MDNVLIAGHDENKWTDETEKDNYLEVINHAHQLDGGDIFQINRSCTIKI